MPTSRRSFLRIAGGAGVILAAGAAGFALTRRPDAALAPWETAGTGYEDLRLRALSHAILAPNPHNMQPWLVHLEDEDTYALTCDTTRLLPHTDPMSRQIVIGLGCFLELARMAAEADGYRAETRFFPEGSPGSVMDARPIARVRLVRDPAAAADPLFAQVFDRRTNKEPFDMSRPVPPADLATIAAVAGRGARGEVVADQAGIKALRDLTWQAHLVEVETPRTYMESVDVMRFGKAEIEANPDGIDIGGPMLEAMHHAGLLTRKSLSDMSSAAYLQGVDMYREILGSAMGYVVLTTPGNSRTDQITAGRDWLRMNLKATELGIGIHPLSQALQEYPEMDDLYAKVHRRLARDGETVQMLARTGYGPQIAPSPRWPIEAKIAGA